MYIDRSRDWILIAHLVCQLDANTVLLSAPLFQVISAIFIFATRISHVFGHTLTDYPPGHTLTDDLPGHTITGDLPGHTLTDDLPGHTLTGDLPGHTLIGDLPVSCF